VLQANEAAFFSGGHASGAIAAAGYTIGCGIAGAHEGGCAIRRRCRLARRRQAGMRSSRPLEKTGVLNAVLVNGVAVRVLDLNVI
jgi:hypothetical protein